MRLKPIRLVALAIGLVLPQATLAEPTTLIADGYVDVLTGEVVRDAVVVVDDGRILALGRPRIRPSPRTPAASTCRRNGWCRG